jgi:hypothetical protein
MSNQMRMLSADTIRWKACAAWLIFLLSSTPFAAAGGAASCAEREVLLQTLVEAHGQVPNAATAMIGEASAVIHGARAACNEGHLEAALPLYDGLIARLASSAGDREAASAIGRAR